jgi:hypothetical protein
MAWSVLQSVSHVATSGNGTVTFSTANLSSGTKIICAIVVNSNTGGSNGMTSVALNDTAVTALTQLVAYETTSGTSWVYLFAVDTPSDAVGTKPTITATWNVTWTNFGLTMLAQEVSGLLAGNTTAMLDGTAGTASASSTGPATTGSYSSSASNEYLVALYGDPGYGVTVTDSSGYTPDANNVNASPNATLMFDYKNSGHTSESASFALSGTAQWGTLLVAFNLGGNIPGPPLTDAPVPVNRPVIVTGRAGWRNAGHSR